MAETDQEYYQKLILAKIDYLQETFDKFNTYASAMLVTIAILDILTIALIILTAKT